ncbi:MAG: AMP-dependent synthetase and ligase [Hydrocarboniphaga sp.]|uniref:class I adenylate-forming enzyme family protein n=1 Tax=Hydrocarboniphaga sp. TaxID=2033016 RepID=UPI00261DF03B|nr:AMP-binding protein [Hydrocarboniphaga sp.]MDB5968683.1 AMP-dependent synthetase and ligase [Hydrocarboniphaga sp.]
MTNEISWIKADEAGKRALAAARSRTMWQAISDAAALDPDRVALVAADDAGNIQRLTYGQLLTRARNFSAGLASIGVQRGDRVVLWMTNRLEWIISAFAAERLGAAVVPINTFLKPVEIKYCIAQSGARHLIMLDRFRKLDMPQMLAEIGPAFADTAEPGSLFAPELPDLRNVVMFARENTRHPGTFDWDELEAVGAVGNSEWLAVADDMARAVTPDDLLMVKYTSGSTGFPKGVMLQQGGFVAVGLLHGRRCDMRREDIYFSMMPFFHAGGSIYGQMSMLPIGGTLVFTEAFDIALAIRLMQQEQPTIFVSVLGKEVVMEAHERGIRFPSVRLGHAHNEAAKVVLPSATFSFSPFGLTETYGPASLTGPDDPLEKQLTTGGRPLPGNEIRVVDPQTGHDVAPGEVGEAWVRGNIMPAYWNKPEESARAIDAEGWLHSEDLVTVDAEGYIRYVGRLKLMAKVGGENVSLEEVENVIKAHEAVTHCAAVGVADPRKVEAVRVYVIQRTDVRICQKDLQLWLKPRLAHFKMPREILFVDDLPRLANGKLDRLALSQWAKREIAA